MNRLESILSDLDAGNPPEMALEDAEAFAATLVGPLPVGRDLMASWVNQACAVFYLLRYIQQARYVEGGHNRTDLLHKAAGLLQTPKPATHLDMVV